ncbi:MAG: hypothetical protein H6741_25970 [Alphaproteobacteria bacterium]|nr:hypothetical protein [Alphaproteobacteria bacterium]
MSLPRRAGVTLPELDPAERITTLSLTLVPLDFIVQWRRCSLTADYLAELHAYHFARREVAREVLSSAFNELVENMVKFSEDKRLEAQVTVSHYGEVLRVRTVNAAAPSRALALAERLDRMAEEDPELLFLEQLEHTAENDPKASGLGLLSLAKDYGARMGATFRPLDGAGALHEIVFTLDFDVDAIEQA